MATGAQVELTNDSDPVVDQQDLAHSAGANGATTVAGKYVGKEHKWARPPSSRWNHEHLYQTLPIAGAIGLTWLFNTVYGPTFYPWLNAHYTPFEINCWWTLALTSGFYWAVGLVFMALDMVPFLHARVAQYKLQPRKITWSEYAQVCGIVARNQLCVNLPLTAASAYFMPRPTDLPLPGLGWTAVVYVVCLGFEEAGFYLVHRAVHSKRLYAKVHKMHHRFSAPVAFASTYCTVAEHLSSNLLPIVLGVGLINAHWSLTIMFFCSLELGTLATHSDYNIPGLSDALQHDWHHYSFTENFGPTGVIDEWLGTNSNYKVWLGELQRRDKDTPGWYTRARMELAQKTQ